VLQACHIAEASGGLRPTKNEENAMCRRKSALLGTAPGHAISCGIRLALPHKERAHATDNRKLMICEALHPYHTISCGIGQALPNKETSSCSYCNEGCASRNLQSVLIREQKETLSQARRSYGASANAHTFGNKERQTVIREQKETRTQNAHTFAHEGTSCRVQNTQEHQIHDAEMCSCIDTNKNRLETSGTLVPGQPKQFEQNAAPLKSANANRERPSFTRCALSVRKQRICLQRSLSAINS
jgi:hypothetical protein